MIKRLKLVAVILAVTLACNFLQLTPTPPSLPTVPPTATVPAVATVNPTPLAGNSFLGLPWGDEAFYAPGVVSGQRENALGIRGATEYHIALTIESDLVNMHGREEILYTNRENVALGEVRLHLYPNIIGGKLAVSNLTVDSQPAQSALELNDSLLIVPLGKSIQPGEQVTLGMDFALSVPTDAETNYGVLASTDGVVTLAHAYPMIAVYDETGWNAEIPADWGDLTYADASYFAVRVTAPAGLTLIASGQQTSHETGSDTQTALFALGPARDFMLVAAKEYVLKSQTVGETQINAYIPANTAEKYTTQVLDTAAEALRVFSQRYAPYPYTEFDVVATPTFALGVEYPGLIAINATLYSDDAPAYYLESTVAHEVGHQWFYNLIGNDQLDQPWLDESLTQFITWQYYEDRYGPDGAKDFKASLEGRWESIENNPIPVGQPVAAYTAREYSAIVYGRGALFFFALRDEIGQEAFDVFLKSYSTNYSWGLSTTDGLKSVAEKSCGCELTPLFDEWIFKP